MTQYDKIAKEYTSFENRAVLRNSLVDPAFFSLLGDVKGKSVLDLACGSGYFTRPIKRLGANLVLGVDISQEMIRLAKDEETARPLGIDYFVGDVADIPVFGKFDLVTAGFLLHYASTKKELEEMCNGIAKNLAPNGRFVTLNNSPVYPTSNTPQYGKTIEALEPIRDGSRLRLKFYNKDQTQNCSFDFFHWSQESYESALEKAGLKDIRWIDIHPTEEAITKLGKDFWNAWNKEPTTILLEARK